MIVAKDVIFETDDEKKYDYVAIDYYTGFRGVAFLRHFNENQVQKIVKKMH